jgi:hypothetical protein
MCTLQSAIFNEVDAPCHQATVVQMQLEEVIMRHLQINNPATMVQAAQVLYSSQCGSTTSTPDVGANRLEGHL